MIIPTIYQPSLQGYQFQPSPYLAAPKQLNKVNGRAGAEAFQMMPNETVALFDADKDIMYIKSTDVSGVPKIRTFAFYEKVEAEVVSEPSPIITREEFDKLKEELLNVKQSVSNTNKYSSSKSNKPNNNTATKVNKVDGDVINA